MSEGTDLIIKNNQILINCNSVKERKWLGIQIIDLLIKFREGNKNESANVRK